MSSDTSVNNILDKIRKINTQNQMANKFDVRIFIVGLVSVFTSVITAVCLSLFQTGGIDISNIMMYVGMIYLNVFSLALPMLAIIESQPWWIWYAVSLSWIMSGALIVMIAYQLTGNLKLKYVKQMQNKFLRGLKWTALLLVSVGVMSYALGWSPLYTAEVYLVLTMNFFAFPIVFFTPFFEFGAPSWVLIVGYWVLHLKDMN
jgi:hypothetical protein